jgi:hypothetical protein
VARSLGGCWLDMHGDMVVRERRGGDRHHISTAQQQQASACLRWLMYVEAGHKRETDATVAERRGGVRQIKQQGGRNRLEPRSDLVVSDIKIYAVRPSPCETTYRVLI